MKNYTLIIISSVVATVLFAGLIVAGLYARPIADDLAYLEIYQSHGSALSATLDQYFGHSGRLSQVALVYVFFALFGSLATRIAPLILLGILALSISLLIYLVIGKGHKARLGVSAIVGLLVSSSALLTLPSLFDSLYWLTSSTVYITSLTGFILVSALLVSVFKYKTWRKSTRLLYILPLLALLQTFGEAGAISSIALSGLALLWTIVDQRKRTFIVQNFIIFMGLISGFLINLLSPGTADRREANTGAQSLSELLRDMAIPFREMFIYIEWWHVTLALLVALVCIGFIPRAKRVINMKAASIALVLTISGFLLISAITFGVSALSVGSSFALRNYTLPHAALFISLVLIFTILTLLLSSKLGDKVRRLYPATLLLVAIVTMPMAIYKQSIYTRAMAARDTFYHQREVSIRNQQANPSSGPIQVPPYKCSCHPLKQPTSTTPATLR